MRGVLGGAPLRGTERGQGAGRPPQGAASARAGSETPLGVPRGEVPALVVATKCLFSD